MGEQHLETESSIWKRTASMAAQKQHHDEAGCWQHRRGTVGWCAGCRPGARTLLRCTLLSGATGWQRRQLDLLFAYTRASPCLQGAAGRHGGVPRVPGPRRPGAPAVGAHAAAAGAQHPGQRRPQRWVPDGLRSSAAHFVAQASGCSP